MSEKLKPLEAKDIHMGCLNCSTACLKAPLTMAIAVGFGDAYIEKDGKKIYDGEAEYQAGKEPKRLQYFEDLAKEEPDADWRLVKYGPMHGETFQRQGNGLWVCVESNQGFA